MVELSVADVVERVNAEAFGKALVTNSLRSMVVEAMLALGLPAGWSWCGADWAGWDLEHDDGARLEVKQSASRQTWAAPKRPSPPIFDIRERSGWWKGAVWNQGVGRHAHIYVFAHHPIADDTADHRDPAQWDFYVLPTSALPKGKSLSLAGLRALAEARAFSEAIAEIEMLRSLRTAPAPPPPLRGPSPP